METTAPVERQLLRIAEAAEVLGLSRSKVYQLVASGELASVTIGRSRRVPLVSLERFLAELTQGIED